MLSKKKKNQKKLQQVPKYRYITNTIWSQYKKLEINIKHFLREFESLKQLMGEREIQTQNTVFMLKLIIKIFGIKIYELKLKQ